MKIFQPIHDFTPAAIVADGSFTVDNCNECVISNTGDASVTIDNYVLKPGAFMILGDKETILNETVNFVFDTGAIKRVNIIKVSYNIL